MMRPSSSCSSTSHGFIILAILSTSASAFCGRSSLLSRRRPGWFTLTRDSINTPSKVSHLFLSTEDSSIVDVEFERVHQANTSSDVSIQEKSSTDRESKQQDKEDSPKSLLDLSLSLDPDWKHARIPFVDPSETRYIDCHLAFTADLDGITYGIAVPCDPAVALTLQQTDGTIEYLRPDDADNEEVMEFMATQLQQMLGDDVFLKRTPKVLTISGNLDKYTDNWRDELFSETIDRETLMDDTDEGLDFFYEFIKSEIGEEEFQKTLKEAETTELDEDIMRLFSVPGLGDEKDNVEGLADMLKDMLSDDPKAPFEAIGENLDDDGIALKLIGFEFRDGKSYALSKLFTPYTIVGKYASTAEADKDDLRFDLLTSKEERIVIPRLEKLCKEDLEAAGLSLTE